MAKYTDATRYVIKAYTNSKNENERIIYDPYLRINDKISEAKLTLKMPNEIDDLEMTLVRNDDKNSLYQTFKPFKTHIEVYQDGKLLFRGRGLKPTREMASSGMMQRTFSFESTEAYLLDSGQRFYLNASMNATDLLKHILKWHNKDVSKDKQVEIRTNDFAKSKTTHYVKIDPMTTRDALNSVLIKNFGGQINFVYDRKKKKNYIDYINPKKKGYQEKQEHLKIDDPSFELGKNLQALTLKMDPSGVITRLEPWGAEKKPKKIALGDDTTTESDGTVTGATKKVHGSWRSAIKNAARLTNTKITESDVNAILYLIQHESTGNEKAVNPQTVNLPSGSWHATGLLQFIQPTFNYYAFDGHKNIKNGFDSLLAGFNAPSFLEDAKSWPVKHQWSPAGEPRFKNHKLPHKYTSKKRMKSLNKWGWPFPKVGKGTFLPGQKFGNHAGNISIRQHLFHDGVDFGSADHKGTNIHAIHGGTVIDIGYLPGVKYYILIHSRDGYNIVYQEAFSGYGDISVKKKATVKTGQIIGRRTQSHLHIGVFKDPYKWDDAYKNSYNSHWHWLDPVKLIEQGGQKGDKAKNAKYYKESNKPRGRIGIKSVNNNKDYLLASPDMIKRFGYIGGPVIFDDAKSAKSLLKQAKAWLKKQEKDFLKESWTISAIELPNYAKYQVGHWYRTRTRNSPMGNDSEMGKNPILSNDAKIQVTQKEIEIIGNPYSSTITCGDQTAGLANNQINLNKKFSNSISKIESSILSVQNTVSTVQSDASDLEDTVDANRSHADSAAEKAAAKAWAATKKLSKYVQDTKKSSDKKDKEYKDFQKKYAEFQKTAATKADIEALNKKIDDLVKAFNSKGGK